LGAQQEPALEHVVLQCRPERLLREPARRVDQRALDERHAEAGFEQAGCLRRLLLDQLLLHLPPVLERGQVAVLGVALRRRAHTGAQRFLVGSRIAFEVLAEPLRDEQVAAHAHGAAAVDGLREHTQMQQRRLGHGHRAETERQARATRQFGECHVADAQLHRRSLRRPRPTARG
jgi:hypothetical protein